MTGATGEPVSRRRFLAGSTLAAGVAVAAVACSDGDDDPGAGFGRGARTGETTPVGADVDLDAAATAATIEKLAFDAYTAVGQLATAGKMGAALPPAVITLMNTAAGQHREAMDAWNRVLTAAGRPEVTTAHPVLKPAVDVAAGKLTDVPAAATLALRLEDYASQTYQKAIPALRSPDVIRLAAQVVVAGAQRQAILRYVLGLYPVGSGPSRDTTDFAPADPKLSLITG
ncbi:MAG: ferritin-like domain-containing protein [Acidimicrobiales bacterium]